MSFMISYGTIKRALVICHGYQAGPLFTKSIKHTLRKIDFFDQILNIELYNSYYGLITNRYSVVSPIINVNEDLEVELTNSLVEHVLKQIKTKLSPEIEEIHFLGHSMGGLVVRSLLKHVIMPNSDQWLFEKNSPNIGSIILLSTPNQGTQVTNLRIVKWIGHLRMAYYFHRFGQPKRNLHLLRHKINRLLGKKEEEHDHSHTHATSQLDQMIPGSLFLQWLNSEPLYTDKIPHYIFCGTKNNLVITDKAWQIPQPDFMDDVHETSIPKDEELIEHLNFDEGLTDILISDTELISDRFENKNIIPNDGVVSLEDVKLPGANLIDLGDHSRHISHTGIIAWFLPSEHVQFVKHKVISIYNSLFEISQIGKKNMNGL